MADVVATSAKPGAAQIQIPLESLTLAAMALVPGVVLVGFAAAGAWRWGVVPAIVVLGTMWLVHRQSAQLTRGAAAARQTAGELASRSVALRTQTDGLAERVAVQERELLHARENTVFALMKLVEARDPSTGVHLERVRAYAKLIATHLGTTARYRDVINEKFIRGIYVAAPLHDIGKVGIADMILLKPARLTPDEIALMRRHVTMGGRTLRAIARHDAGNPFVEMAYELAMYHHEWWDGTGYPFGIAGTHIPLPARIVALADVYDALTSKRCYKPAYSHTDARANIVSETGTHFDPDVVEAFLARELDFVRIREALTGDHAIHSEDLPEMGRAPGIRGAA